MDLKTRLITIPPRDLSGSESSDRFSYQHTWALCHLLELHISGQDYVIIFDHHEDVTVLDSASEPTEMSGYQIKTKDSSNFTIKNLLTRKPGGGSPPAELPSILGKLYDLKVRFPDEVKLLSIVSNASVSVRLGCDGKMHYDRELTRFEELHEEQRELITKSLREEAALGADPQLSGMLQFLKSDIPLRKHDTHARGRLVEFLQELFPDREFRIIPLFRSLLSEVVVRNNSSEQIETFEDLLKHKSLSRESFGEVLQQAGVCKGRVELTEVVQRLSTEDCPFDLLTAIRREWDAVQIDRLAERDIPRLRLLEAIRESLDRHGSEPRLLDVIKKAFEEVRPKLRSEWDFSDIYIKTAIVIEAYER